MRKFYTKALCKRGLVYKFLGVLSIIFLFLFYMEYFFFAIRKKMVEKLVSSCTCVPHLSSSFLNLGIFSLLDLSTKIDGVDLLQLL